MKKNSLLLLLLTCFAVLLNGCMKDSCRRTYTLYSPILKSLTQVRADMRGGAPQPLKSTGKLTVFGNTIFLNERGKGIHIIDNSNPASPRNAGFINIPGNIDLAVKGHYLFADSYSDLAVFDISNPTSASPVTFLNNVMKEKNVYWWGSTNPDSIKVVVGYTQKDTTVDCGSYALIDKMYSVSSCSSCMQSGGGTFYSAAPTQTGTNGSMAGFALVNDYLYAVGSASLYCLNISNPAAPQQTTVKTLPWGIETIYPFQNKLFIGSTTGMFIFDLANPGSPTQQGTFSHVTRCDPVIADGNYAYVTLRGGTVCNGTTNELNVVDVSNLSAPVLRNRYTLSNPYGLAKDGNLLFVCDGKAGLKVYDAASPLSLQEKKTISGLETYDIIAGGSRAVVVAKDGLYQYAYTADANVTLLSKLSIENK